MRKLLAIILAVMTMTSVACAAPEYGEHATVATVDYDELYWGQGISYTRVIELQHSGEHNGTLVATYEMYTSGLRVEKPGYNIHVSHDGGSTWEMVATVREKAAAIQSEFQPFLYELPSQVGDMPAGTLLLAACSIDAGHGRQSAIRMYRSYDIGKSWEQFGTVSVGGGLETGVWEPFLMVLPDGRLACYYSDATDEPNHSQKLVMKISEDGVNWGDVIDIVALSDQRKRPGMATIVQLNDGRFMMTYEMCDAEDPGCGNPITYRFSDDGISWGDPKDPGIKVVTDTGAVPGSAPYLAYLPNVGDNGLLLMTAVFQTPSQKKGNIVYYNDNMGAEDSWKTWYLPQNYRNPDGDYSRAIFTAMDGQTAYFVNNIPDANSEEGYYKMIFVRYRFDESFITS